MKKVALRITLSLVSILLVCCAMPTDAEPSTATMGSQYIPGDCPFAGEAWAAGHAIECGELIVPRNRRKGDRETLRLPIAILKSTSPTPAPDPVLFLQGGPGIHTLRYTKHILTDPLVVSLRQERDYILLDQRGTGADSSNVCVRASNSPWALDLTPAQHRAHQRENLARCRDQLTERGVDISAYNSTESMADVHDLMRLLPYDEWNIFGVSYGVRLALMVMRDSTAPIRSVVLDSPVSVTDPTFDFEVPRLASALDDLFAECEADPACRASYPDLRATFYQMIQDYEAEPFRVRTADKAHPDGIFVANAGEIVYAVNDMLSMTKMRPIVPLFIQQVEARNEAALAVMVDQLGGGEGGTSHTNASTMWSALCHDEMSFASQEQYLSASAGYPTALQGLGYRLHVCTEWPAGRALEHQVQPVHSAVPVLLLQGDNDHLVAEASQALATRLENVRRYVISGTSHFVTSTDSCSRTLVSTFLADSDQPIDATCVAAGKPQKLIADVYLTSGASSLANTVMRGNGTRSIVWLMATIFVLLSGPLFWISTWMIRYVRQSAPPSVSGTGTARWITGLAATAALSFLGLLVFAMLNSVDTNPLLWVFGLPGSVWPIFLLLPLIAAMSLAAVWLALRSWRANTWPGAGRIHLSIVTGGLISFLVFVQYWGLY